MWGLTKSQEGVFRVHEHQHSPEQVFIHDVGLDVIGVVLHTEGQKLQNQCQQLSCLEVIYTNRTRLLHFTICYMNSDSYQVMASNICE